jgi:hypothetical protein
MAIDEVIVFFEGTVVSKQYIKKASAQKYTNYVSPLAICMIYSVCGEGKTA